MSLTNCLRVPTPASPLLLRRRPPAHMHTCTRAHMTARTHAWTHTRTRVRARTDARTHKEEDAEAMEEARLVLVRKRLRRDLVPWQKQRKVQTLLKRPTVLEGQHYSKTSTTMSLQARAIEAPTLLKDLYHHTRAHQHYLRANTTQRLPPPRTKRPALPKGKHRFGLSGFETLAGCTLDCSRCHPVVTITNQKASTALEQAPFRIK